MGIERLQRIYKKEMEAKVKTIGIEELEQKEIQSGEIIDIRPQDQYSRGTFPGAVNIPMEEFEDRLGELDKEKIYYLICHTGEHSQEYVHLLEEQGYQAVNVIQSLPEDDFIKVYAKRFRGRKEAENSRY